MRFNRMKTHIKKQKAPRILGTFALQDGLEICRCVARLIEREFAVSEAGANLHTNEITLGERP